MRLKDYIQGNRRGKEANRLEREAMNDPFLEDALDGFDTVSGNHVPIIERLEKKFANPATVPRKKRSLLLYWSVAASVLLLTGVGAYFFLTENEKTTTVIAMHQPDEKSYDISVDDSAELQMTQMDEPQKEAPVVARAPQKTPEIPLDLDEWQDVSDVVADNVVVADKEIVAITEYVAAETAGNRSFDSSAKLIVKSEHERPAIHGKVVDEAGEPLPGVTVMEKGTTKGTVTDIGGNFTLKSVSDDSAKLIASFVGYETQELKPSGEPQTVTMRTSTMSISEVAVTGSGVRKRTSASGAVYEIDNIVTVFGENEFQNYCGQNADRNVCKGRGATVKISFFIDENGKPVKIECKKYSCEEAKNEIEKLLSSSPAWTKREREVSMTVRW